MEDNHERCAGILLEHIPKSALPQQPTVIHVGAHKGEEVPIYKEYGFDKIHLIEANPELSQYLVKKFNLESNINVENFAISNREEKVEFIIHKTESGSLESSSMLKLKQLSEIVPIFDSSKIIKVNSCTLDGFYRKHFCVAERVGLLVLDIQGAELLALQGAMSMLEYTDAVICEVNLIETYEGCASEE